VRLSARNFTVVGAAVAGLVTLSTAVVPFIPFAFRNPSLHVAVDATEALIAALVVYLLVGRLRQTGKAGDLALIFALSVLSVTNLVLSVLPPETRGGDEFFTWFAIITRLIGATVLAASPFLGERGRKIAVRHAGLAALGAVLTVSLVAMFLAPFAQSLPVGIELSGGPGTTSRLQIEGHSILLAFQLVGALLYFVAAIGFTRRAELANDPLMRWFGAGSAVAGFARVNFFLFPSLYSNYVYTGDLLRLGFYMFLLVGASREIVSYWESRAEAARLEERRRVARDLHDGLAQELVVVASQAHRLERSSERDPGLRQLVNSVERAVGEARRAISALTGPEDQSLHAAITELVEQVAERTESVVDADLDPEVRVAAQVREQLVRIVREALTNAIRHARPSSVAVRLRQNGSVVLEIFDDGIGFDPEKAGDARDRFGLVMMKERARAIGGDLSIQSKPGEGTLVRVELT
jgi:signal transduction histidine kinase